MAAGGMIQPMVAITKLRKIRNSLSAAEESIICALQDGSLGAQGLPVIRWDRPPLAKGELRDLAFGESWPVYGERTDIPLKFWSDLLVKDVDRWDWHEGQFHNTNSANTYAYHNITFKEKDVNALVRTLTPSTLPPLQERKERRRDATWNDWIAAVAILGHEQRIKQGMKQRELLDLIEGKLTIWGLDGKEETTVQPAARAILARYQTHPPVLPLACEKKPQKP